MNLSHMDKIFMIPIDFYIYNNILYDFFLKKKFNTSISDECIIDFIVNFFLSPLGAVKTV